MFDVAERLQLCMHSLCSLSVRCSDRRRLFLLGLSVVRACRLPLAAGLGALCSG